METILNFFKKKQAAEDCISMTALLKISEKVNLNRMLFKEAGIYGKVVSKRK